MQPLLLLRSLRCGYFADLGKLDIEDKRRIRRNAVVALLAISESRRDIELDVSALADKLKALAPS